VKWLATQQPYGVNLGGAKCTSADLTCLRLPAAILRDAQFGESDMSCADLRGAHLEGTDLSATNLRQEFEGQDENAAVRLGLFASNVHPMTFDRVSPMREARSLPSAVVQGTDLVARFFPPTLGSSLTASSAVSHALRVRRKLWTEAL
jgi:hypothetical protein